MDETLLRLVYCGGDAHGALTALMLALSWLGNGVLLVLLVPLALWRRTSKVALALAAVIVTQASLVWGLKLLFGRVRPWRALGLVTPMAPPADFSFPSGHAAGAFAVATFLALVVRMHATRAQAIAVASLAYVVACGIALSRVYLGAHWPSDVVAGAVFGAAIGWAGAIGYARLRAGAAAP